MSTQSGSGERAESLGVRRSVELPEADIDAAEDLAPADGSDSVEQGDEPDSADAADDEAADPPSAAREEAADSEGPDAAPARAVAVATPPGTGAGVDDGMPPDRPKKTVLAAVAIGGAVLLTIPILLIGAGSHDGKTHRTSAAADRLLPGDGQQPPPGAFVSSSPSITPTPSATASPKAKPKATKHGAAKPAGTLAAKHTGGGSRLPTGPKFGTVTHLMIKNVMTGMCADIPGGANGGLTTPIQQWTCHGTSDDNQRWDLVVNDKGAGPHGADLFSIRNSKDSYCADLPGTGPVSGGTHVTENLCYPGLGDNQMWYLDKKATNSFWIRNYVSGRSCLDVLGVDGAGGKDAALTVVPCDPKDDHLWSFS